MREPSQLFSCNSKDIVKKEYNKMMKRWHPDNFKGDEGIANSVSSKISELYERAIEQIDKGEWIEPGVVRVESKEGKTYRIKFLDHFLFEIGETYIASSVVVHILDGKHKWLIDNMKENRFKKLEYPSKKIQDMLERCMPKVKAEFETSDGRYCVVYEKTSEVVQLKRLRDYFGGKLDIRHTAWVVSRLITIGCLLEYNGIVFNGFTLENMYVSPEYHTVCMLSGWWYAKEANSKLEYVPRGVYECLSNSVKESKVSNKKVDAESIRYIARQLLGDRAGSKIRFDSSIPEAMKKWLLGVDNNDTFLDAYDEWGKVLEDSFGERKFIRMEVNYNDFYDKK